jgi:hypothetical protein
MYISITTSPRVALSDQAGSSDGPKSPREEQMSDHPVQAHGQLGRRDPTEMEALSRKPFVLTERDVSILTAIFTHGFLTTELIELAYFPVSGLARRSPSSRAYDRLRSLWLWGFVDRVVRPTTPGLGTRFPYLLALGSCAIPVVAQWLELPPATIRGRRLDRINPYGIEHDLAVARLWANLRAVFGSVPGAAMRWTSERTLRARGDHVRNPETRRSLPFLPDGYVELDRPGRPTGCFLVEVDRGTLTLERFARKVLAFELFLAQGCFTRRYGQASFDVLVLGEGEERLDNLASVAASVVSDDRYGAYRFTRLAALVPRRTESAIWRNLHGDRIPLLSMETTASAMLHGGNTVPPDVPATPRADAPRGDADVSP